MAISAFKTFSAGEALTASDLNSSFTQIVNNGADLVSPFTKDIAAGGFGITGLRAAAAAGEAVRFEQWRAANAHPFEHRLTLTNGTPVTTGDVTGATSVYLNPYAGNRIALYDGVAGWDVYTSTGLTLALSGAMSSVPHDVFVLATAGVLSLEAVAWTNGLNRNTALTTQDGVLVQNGNITKRYVGTFYPTSVSATEDSFAKRYLWNYYNRVARPMRVLEATNTWTYSTATIRAANNSSGNRLNFVIGWSEDEVSAQLHVTASNSLQDTYVAIGIGVDSTSEFTTGGLYHQVSLGDPDIRRALTASWRGFPGVGVHYLSWNEYAVATGTTTWVGDDGGPTLIQNGIHGVIRA